jgi:hypothetical protein
MQLTAPGRPQALDQRTPLRSGPVLIGFEVDRQQLEAARRAQSSWSSSPSPVA